MNERAVRVLCSVHKKAYRINNRQFKRIVTYTPSIISGTDTNRPTNFTTALIATPRELVLRPILISLATCRSAPGRRHVTRTWQCTTAPYRQYCVPTDPSCDVHHHGDQSASNVVAELGTLSAVYIIIIIIIHIL